MSSTSAHAIRRIATAAAVGALVAASPAPAAGGAAAFPLRLRAAAVTQRGEDVVLTVRTASPWTPDATPAGRAGRLCLRLAQAPTPPERVCAGGRGGLRLVRRTAHGGWASARLAGGVLSVQAPGTLVLTFAMATARLAPGPVSWSVSTTWSAAPCSEARPCTSSAVARRGRPLVLVTPRVVGCEPAGPTFRLAGDPQVHEVALTFDDGPGADTPAVLSALESAHVPATFFVLGSRIAGHEGLLRRMLVDGDAVGDHSFTHADLSRDGAMAHEEIARTAALVTAATGYAPCLFRAPYGLTSQPLIDDARAQGMLTIQWDVDPRDWSLPGTPSIVATVLRQTRDGSIVLMHDGGGNRRQTAAALPAIIRELRRRGERLVTVPELLGLAPRYAGAPPG